ncbi:amidohydrolase family protein [Modestobacter versicolor]|uniref:amidohydrolase family protein n=1 Tax=Modestobacter versicolor TaxID=429133 RepID=UPI0034DFA9AC
MWLTDASVVDVLTGSIARGRAVELTADGLVGRVLDAAPDGEPTRSLGGRYLLPGLVSVHSHLSVVYPFSATDEAENPGATLLRSFSRARDALHAGVTTVRSVHEIHRADLLLRTASREGWIDVPRIVGAGRAVSAAGGHGTGTGSVYATGPDEFYELARAELAAGADHVKVFITGGIADPDEGLGGQMTAEEMRAVVRAAEEFETYVVAHAGQGEAIATAMDAGMRSFEHAYDLSADVAAEMARREVFLTPTLCVTRCPEWMADHSFTAAQIETAMEVGPRHLESIRRAVEAGVTIVAGTDYPPGEPIEDTVCAVREMEFLTDAGLEPLKALQAGTSTAARLLGLSGQVGEVSTGAAADLLVTDADPTSDVSALRGIRLVVQAGRIVRDDLPAGVAA